MVQWMQSSIPLSRAARIGPGDSVQHAPQHVAFEGERRHSPRLLICRPAVLRHHLQSVLRVARRLHQAGAEIGQPRRVNPGVEALERGQALCHQIRRKQLGQRGGHRLDPRAGAGEGDVGINSESYPGHDVPLVPYLLPRQSHSLAQAQPGLDAPLPVRCSILVEDAPDPASAYLTVRAVGEDSGVLPWDVLLVVEAVGHPALDLPAAQASLVFHRLDRLRALLSLPTRRPWAYAPLTTLP